MSILYTHNLLENLNIVKYQRIDTDNFLEYKFDIG